MQPAIPAPPDDPTTAAPVVLGFFGLLLTTAKMLVDVIRGREARILELERKMDLLDERHDLEISKLRLEIQALKNQNSEQASQLSHLSEEAK